MYPRSTNAWLRFGNMLIISFVRHPTHLLIILTGAELCMLKEFGFVELCLLNHVVLVFAAPCLTVSHGPVISHFFPIL